MPVLSIQQIKTMNSLPPFKIKASSFLSSILSAIGLTGGTTSAVCQTTCVATSGIGLLAGASLATTPLAFLGKYHRVFWLIGMLLFVMTITYALVKEHISSIESILFFFNAGILLISFPFFPFTILSRILFLCGIGILAYTLYKGIIIAITSLRKARLEK